MSFTLMVWVGFLALICVIIALDLGVFHRTPRMPSLREAVGWSLLWLFLALMFSGVVWALYEYNPRGWDMDTEQISGQQAVLEYLTGYVVEKSLSVDNIFVIAMIFAHFRVPPAFQHRVLFWGILGALVLRGILIVAGLALIDRFAWLTYPLGLLLIYSAAKMLMLRHDTVDVAGSPVIGLVQRFLPVTERFDEDRFFTRIDGVRHATPLFVALVLVEFSDLIFAMDSIPAIFAITQDPFIVFTSNIFALLGLRSLYFVLAGLIEKFRYLKASLVFLLGYIGVKMLLVHHYPIPTPVSLAVIGGILAIGMLASLNVRHDPAPLASPLEVRDRRDD